MHEYRVQVNWRQVRCFSTIDGGYRRDGKWDMKIKHKGIPHDPSQFDDEIESAKAHDRKVIEFLGGYAWLNFPLEAGEQPALRNAAQIREAETAENGGQPRPHHRTNRQPATVNRPLHFEKRTFCGVTAGRRHVMIASRGMEFPRIVAF